MTIKYQSQQHNKILAMTTKYQSQQQDKTFAKTTKYQSEQYHNILATTKGQMHKQNISQDKETTSSNKIKYQLLHQISHGKNKILTMAIATKQ